MSQWRPQHALDAVRREGGGPDAWRRERDRILATLTPIEREMYRAIGGVLKPTLEERMQGIQPPPAAKEVA